MKNKNSAFNGKNIYRTFLLTLTITITIEKRRLYYYADEKKKKENLC